MTLYSLKKNLRLTSILTFLVIYGLTSYLIGKSSAFENIFKSQFAKTQDQIENPIEQPLPYSDVQSGSVISSYVKLCSNTVHGFEVAYPKDWFTTYNNDDQKCTFFAPYSFVVNFNAEDSQVPVRIEPVKVEDWLSTVKFYDNPNDFQNIVESRSIEIDGRSVKKIKSIATGAGPIPRGFEKVSFLVFDSQTPLVIYYQQMDIKDDIEKFEDGLDQMASSLRYF